MNDQNVIEQLELKYSADSYNGRRLEFSAVRMISGNIPVLIDAPHAVRQVREQQIKAADAYTGAMAEWLCAQTGAYGCIRFYNDNCDPNYDLIGKGKEYREELGKFCKKNAIKLVIDLHGTANQMIVAELGTNNGNNLCGHLEYTKQLAQTLRQLGKVSVDERFCASRKENICRSLASECGIPAIQIEIGSIYRKSREERAQFLKIMTRFITDVAKNVL